MCERLFEIGNKISESGFIGKGLWFSLNAVHKILEHLACAAKNGFVYADMKAGNCLYLINESKAFNQIETFLGDIGGLCKPTLTKDAGACTFRNAYKNFKYFCPCNHFDNQFNAVIMILSAIFAGKEELVGNNSATSSEGFSRLGGSGDARRLMDTVSWVPSFICPITAFS